MSQKVEEDSLVKVDYVGRFPENGDIFDTSNIEVAKENGIYNEERDYKPLEVPMGEKKVIPGFEDALAGMELGETKSFKLNPENAYGQRDDQKVVQIPDDQFKDNEIPIQVGAMVQTQSGVATIVNHNDSQVTLDFNHPLAGRSLEFEIEVKEIE